MPPCTNNYPVPWSQPLFMSRRYIKLRCTSMRAQMNAVLMILSCVISPSSNRCVFEPSAGYFTSLTRITTASSVTWNSTVFRCRLKLHGIAEDSKSVLVTVATLHLIMFAEILFWESSCTSSLRGREDCSLEEHQRRRAGQRPDTKW